MRDPTKDPIWRSLRNHRILWRKQVQPRWHEYQWVVVGGIWLAALYLGYVGFAKHAAAQGESLSPLDRLYLTLQLIALNSGAVSGSVSWELEVARWLIPVLAAYAVIRGLALLFRERVQLARLRFIRDHVVICGLSRKGFLLARDFRKGGKQVVIVEQDEDNDFLEQCRARRQGRLSEPARIRTARPYMYGGSGAGRDARVPCPPCPRGVQAA